MTIGFYTSSQGVLQTQAGMDIVSNNMANISTNGYKPLRASFSDLFYTTRNKENEDVEMGHGVKIDKTDLMFDAGTLQKTEGVLDFAIPTEGLFAIEKPNGDVVYTKDGAFQAQQNEEGEWDLIDDKGANVLDYDKNPVQVEFKEDGSVDTDATMEKLGVFRFENPYGLRPDGNNYYLETLSSGESISDDILEKKGGFLEVSSADVANEMVNVIQMQRAFSFNAKLVQTADQIETIVNNLR